MKQYLMIYLDWVSQKKARITDERAPISSSKAITASRILRNKSLSEHFEKRNWNSHFVYKEDGGK